MRLLVTQLTRFGLVGLVGLGIDLLVFNALRLTVFDTATVEHGAFYAKIVSTSLAIIANWLGNRYWTFRHARRPHWVREGIEFAAVSVGGLIISLACLWVSHYLLGFTSILADNIATNFVGLGLGTIFRFTFYRLWVFRGEIEEEEADAAAATHDSGAVPAESDRTDGIPLAEAPASRLV